MKLESLKNDKFKSNVLKREQMFRLNGGQTETTPAGQACGSNTVYPFQTVIFDYSWDSIRNGSTYYHGRSNMKEMSQQDCLEATGR